MRQKTNKKRKKQVVTNDYHHGDLRASLIEAALQLLKTNSPETLSLRELARVAGVSQAAPYRHFKDKKELLAAIIQQGFQRKFQYMFEAIENAKENPQEMYFACGLAYFRMGLKHQQHFRLMTSGEVVPDPKYPDLLEAASSTFILLCEMIKYCQKKKVIGSGDHYNKAMNCWCVVNGYTALYVENRLGFLGVTEKNAESGLKTLLSQYLIGNSRPLEESNFQFELFQTTESKFMREMVLSKSHPQVDALFNSLK